MSVSCGDNERLKNKLVPEEKIKIEVKEPSGLSLAINEDAFFVVSDEYSFIYEVNFSGKVTKKIKIEGSDFEGISVLGENNYAVVSETENNLIITDSDGSLIKQKSFMELNIVPNNGFEGVTFNKNNYHLYILHEKNPRLLIELDEKLNLIKSKEIKFLNDLSGIAFDEKKSCLWILSDESKIVAKCDLNGELIKLFKIDIPKAEGIAIDQKNKFIYIVSDRTSNLYKFNIPE